MVFFFQDEGRNMQVLRQVWARLFGPTNTQVQLERNERGLQSLSDALDQVTRQVVLQNQLIAEVYQHLGRDNGKTRVGD